MYRALLVDDEKANLDVIINILSRYKTFDALEGFTDPYAAYEAAKAVRPDIIFADIEMPGMNGLELAERILELNPDIKIVFITAYDDYAVEAFELYAMDYILKPVQAERLDKTIKRITGDKNSKSTGAEVEKLSILAFKNLEVFKGQRSVKWKGAKTGELFAFLLENIRKSIHKDSIVDILWPDYDYKRALANMQTAMCRVRQSMNELGEHMSIEYSCNCYKLTMKDICFDLQEFEELTRDIVEINTDNIVSAVKALELYTGDYLEQNGFTWAVLKQITIKRRFEEILKAILKYYKEIGKRDSAVNLLKRLIYINPSNEIVKKYLKNLI